jgi:hypothetical protein
MTARRPLLIAGSALAVLVAVTGCTAESAQTESPPASATAATATASATATAQLPLPTGTIGSGALTSDNGTTGTVHFSFDGALLTLTIDDLVTPTTDAVEAVIAVHALPTDQTCFDSGFRVPFGTFEGGKATNNAGDFSIFSGDPSGIDQVILVTIPEWPYPSDTTCLATVVARADIRWAFEPLRSYLHPVDSGVTGGARGVTESIDGKLAGYTVEPNDLIDEVAARFGITVDDLFYLNNSRIPNAGQHTLSVGERLNLSLADR